jgi:hypothetical protein
MSVFIHIFAMGMLVCLYLSIKTELHKRTRWLEKKMSRNPNIDYRRREMTIAFLLVTVVIVFIICHTLRCFLSFIELVEVAFGMSIKNYQKYFFFSSDISVSSSLVSFLSIMVPFSHLLLACNCSVNILIYCAKDDKFWTGCLNTYKAALETW